MKKEKINHPDHLTPEIIQSALFIHNAEDSQDAQKRIINVARRLSDEGSIVLAGRGGDDYV